MRFTYIKLKGYVGIYNGLGLDEIEIDLSRCRNKICTIVGINGCGKSTLLKALTILPDGSESFMPGVNAEKILKIADGNNEYHIRITSAASKAGRGLSKATISKNGIELNPNGNIGSYKEVIFQEFDLDSNYITLCRLSSEDRGLADKSPAERKKMVSFIVDSLDTYNAIYKNLNKKSSIFKSYVNNLHTKIQNVGNEDNIRATVSILTNRRSSLIEQKKSLESKIVELNTMIKIYDPDNKIQQRYEECQSDMEEKNDIMNQNHNKFKSICQKLGIEATQEAVIKFIVQNTEVLDGYKQNMTIYNESRLALVEKNESLNKTYQANCQKIESLSEGIDSSLSSSIVKVKSRVDNEIKVLNRLGVSDPDNVSKEELKLAFDTTTRIISMIDDLYYEIDENIIEKMFTFDPASLRNMSLLIDNKSKIIEDLRKKMDQLKSDNEILSILDNRPESCNIDDCYFIKKAYMLQKEKYSTSPIGIQMESLTVELSTRVAEYDSLVSQFEELSVVSHKYEKLNLIRSTVETNRDILCKSSICNVLVNEYEYRIKEFRSFNDFRDLDELIDQVNVVSMYKEDSRIYNQLSIDYQKQVNSEKLVEQFKEENESIKEEINRVQADLVQFTNKVNSYNDLINTFNAKVNMAGDAKELCLVWLKSVEDLKKSKQTFDEVLDKSRSSVKTIQEIAECSAEIKNLETQIAPLETQISTEQGKLLMLESYKEEYAKYSEKYNVVDTLKKYSSPTSGIQTLFMNIYMSKTLDLANRVLSMIFGGQYKLLDYVINASEFKIPFIGQGMRVDDISSGSTSQICMMGMVLNLVLKYQASNKYNIASLDEIDGGLDTRNRLSFVNVLYRLIDILELDQVFVISHSMELESSNVDIIKLKQYQDYGESVSMSGNVIYDFNQIQH